MPENFTRKLQLLSPRSFISRRDAETQSILGLPSAEVSELESGDPNWESRHLGGSRWGTPIKSLLPWGLSPRVILTQRHRDTEAQRVSSCLRHVLYFRGVVQFMQNMHILPVFASLCVRRAGWGKGGICKICTYHFPESVWEHVGQILSLHNRWLWYNSYQRMFLVRSQCGACGGTGRE